MAYWQPLYGFVRRRGLGPENAADVVQAYFACFLEKHYLRSVLPEFGRFRSLMLPKKVTLLRSGWHFGATETAATKWS